MKCDLPEPGSAYGMTLTTRYTCLVKKVLGVTLTIGRLLLLISQQWDKMNLLRCQLVWITICLII
jgi:hypothetical protein